MQQRKSEWDSASPSWKKLETRSTSFPHTRNPLQDVTEMGHRRGSKSRSKMALAKRSNTGPAYSSLSTLQQNTTKATAEGSPPNFLSQRRSRMVKSIVRPTPVLTVALLKLDEYLPNYCECLKEPTFENAQKAMQVLDTVVIADTPPTGRSLSSPKSSPAPNMAGSPGSIKSSPSRSPIASWFIGSSYQTESAGPNQTSNGPFSTVFLEGEWDTFVNPLNLFAGLEAIYSSLAHASPDRIVALNLFRLYQRAKEDLNRVRETLCDPFLPTSETSLDHTSNLSPLNLGTATSATASSSAKFISYREKASAVGMSLDAIQSVCQCRCQLIRHQLTLWNTTDSLDFDDAASLFQTILPPLPAERASSASPIIDSVILELEGWFRLMDLASSLCQCRYVRSRNGTEQNHHQVMERRHVLPRSCRNLQTQLCTMRSIIFQTPHNWILQSKLRRRALLLVTHTKSTRCDSSPRSSEPSLVLTSYHTIRDSNSLYFALLL
jgi:hypothetical protein